MIGRDVWLRRVRLPRGGSATCALGPVERCLEAVELERPPKSSLGLAVASSDGVLRRILESRALRSSNVVGCVDPRAFASVDSALVASADCGDGIEALTFDSCQGALPDMGRSRLADLLSPGRSPHFLVFAGRHVREEEDPDDAVLTTFARRVEGLFPGSTFSGALVRGEPGRLVHARRRLGKRAGRLRVYRAQAAAVGLALLPKAPEVAEADVAECVSILSTLTLGGRGAMRLWAAGEAAAGPDDQRVLASLMHFYQAFEDKSTDRIATMLDEHPSAAHPGQRCVRGRDNVLASWQDILDHPASTRIQVTDVNIVVTDSLAYATCLQALGNEGGRIQATNVFAKIDETWRLKHYHGSLHFEDDDDDFLDHHSDHAHHHIEFHLS